MVQLVTSMDRRHVQLVTMPLPTIISVNINSPTYVPRGFTHQPLDGGQPWDSPKGSFSRRHPLGGPPFNPLVGTFGWPTFD
jgi:hypothetical protein